MEGADNAVRIGTGMGRGRLKNHKGRGTRRGLCNLVGGENEKEQVNQVD